MPFLGFDALGLLWALQNPEVSGSYTRDPNIPDIQSLKPSIPFSKFPGPVELASLWFRCHLEFRNAPVRAEKS
jgi:hypothetical protein